MHFDDLTTLRRELLLEKNARKCKKFCTHVISFLRLCAHMFFSCLDIFIRMTRNQYVDLKTQIDLIPKSLTISSALKTFPTGKNKQLLAKQ